MKRIMLCLLILPLLMAGGVYKWTDENGKVHFGDRPNNIDNAEQVVIREQKTGSMGFEAIKEQKPKEPNYRYAAKEKPRPVSTAPSHACNFAKNLLAQKRLKLSQLRKRGYKQYERADAEDAIEIWQLKVKSNCS